MAAHEIPCTPAFSFITALGDPVRMRQWAIWGLPRDDVSAANGIVIFNSKRWPLCIDPQVSGVGWLVLSWVPDAVLRQVGTLLRCGLPHLPLAWPLCIDPQVCGERQVWCAAVCPSSANRGRALVSAPAVAAEP